MGKHGRRLSILLRSFIVLGLTFVILICVAPASNPADAIQQSNPSVHLAYVHNNTVKLADAEGNPTSVTGPEFQVGRGANLFWTPDGERLYIARRDGLFLTGAAGGAASRLPGNYGLSVILDRQGEVFYYLDTFNPVEGETSELVTYPLRELNAALLEGGTGRLVEYIGQYPVGSSEAVLNAAAMQYARDGGLLGIGRPRIFPTYGPTMFYSCCFPSPGINALDLSTTDKYPYDTTFIPGPAALNSSQSRLAGPTTEGTLRTIDLISAGTRDYTLDIGEVERLAWALDDSAIYIAARSAPQNPLQLNPVVTTPIDTRSASITIWRLDLVTGRLRQLVTLGDYYGVSSMAATSDYVFVVAVESNVRLVEDLNAGRLPPDISQTDPRLMGEYLPGTILFRVPVAGGETLSVLSDVWGIVARPRR
jgi:hypothetical protein